YLAPLIYLTKDELKTIQIGIRAFMTTNGVEYSLILAATCLGVAPLLLVYICCQRYFIDSAASTGLKG
ncbi:MAG: carbohydrate ABC transporter permease, partial [Faecousia sp.]